MDVRECLQSIINQVSNGRACYFGDHTGYEPQFSSEQVESWRTVLAEQPRAAEQGQQGVMTVTYKEPCKQPCTRWVYKEDSGPLCDDCGAPLPKDKQPAHPLAGECQPHMSGFYSDDALPAGDVVERMLNKYHAYPYRNEEGMAAALAVARYGLVSLDDVEKAITDTIVMRKGDVLLAMEINKGVRARLAKPAEQTDERVTWSQLSNGSALVRLDGNDIATFYRGPYDPKHAYECAERYAVELREDLRNGKEGK